MCVFCKCKKMLEFSRFGMLENVGGLIFIFAADIVNYTFSGKNLFKNKAEVSPHQIRAEEYLNVKCYIHTYIITAL